MPLYEYRCDICRVEFERYVTTSSPATHCPSCGSERVIRKISIVQTRKNNVHPPFTVPTHGCGDGCG